MDAPAISSITPDEAPVNGRVVVRILGARFRPDFAPLPQPVQPPYRPSVRVSFGEEVAETVYVLSATELRVVVPPSVVGDVDVRVVNLERDGSEVPGEYVVKAGAFTYKMPDLSVAGDEGVVSLVTRHLRRLLSARLLRNTNITVHTDFDATPESEIGHLELSELPALIITGPKLTEDRRRARNVRKEEALGDGTVRKLPTTYVAMLSYTATLITDSTRELHTLQGNFTRFFEDNPWLFVPAADGSRVRLEMRFLAGAAPSATLGPSDSNVRQITGVVQVLGVELDAADGSTVELTAPVTDSYTPPGAAATSPGAGVVISAQPLPKE